MLLSLRQCSKKYRKTEKCLGIQIALLGQRAARSKLHSVGNGEIASVVKLIRFSILLSACGELNSMYHHVPSRTIYFQCRRKEHEAPVTVCFMREISPHFLIVQMQLLIFSADGIKVGLNRLLQASIYFSFHEACSISAMLNYGAL